MSRERSRVGRPALASISRASTTTSVHVAIVAAALGLAAPAYGSDPTCNDAYTASQQLRRGGKLRAARVQALACGQEACTTTVRTDCAQWLQEIERATPSILVDARNSTGNELTDVSVYVDGERVTERLDGKQILLDPGDHEFRFEHAGQVANSQVLVREGEKYRILQIAFPGSSRSDMAERDTRDESSSLEPTPKAPEVVGDAATSRTVPAVSIALAATAAVGLVAFAALSTTAYARELDLRHTCGPTHTCDPSDIDSVHTQYLVGDVALAVSVVSLGAAAVFFFTAPPSDAPRAAHALAVRMAVTPRSTQVFLGARF